MRNRKVCFILLPVAFMASSGLVAAEDVRGVKLPQQGLRVIEEKCLVCHNRKRIDEAMRERRDVDRIMRRMEQKGARLTEQERRVIGHFWKQKLFKGEVGETPAKEGGGFSR